MRIAPFFVFIALLLLLAACTSKETTQIVEHRPSSDPVSANSEDPLAPENAIRNLELYPSLEATLFASEPTISSVTNLDIDHRGRVWVCDVMNYREWGAQNTRPEGDRILILEDVDGDGVADTSKTYYQGRDVDAALGICVLGNQVIVSCAPNIILFTDEDGDDLPDRKEYLFTETGNIQSDHSTHSVVYGPDGKLYWNFGNAGRHVHDKEGNLVIDQAGNPVFDRRYPDRVKGYKAEDSPYWGGMIFRCNPDGSELETLAHNFRNNYEVAIDSFGGLWQSDNDDDGNFGVRLNYILEYGNYGYLDELTGAGWRIPRISQHAEIPQRHWHQNDPGVVPNFVQTGAGSPTGITVYEGDLLPEIFHGQVLHCDAGPGVVWSPLLKEDGAGFQGELVNLLKEAKRGWVRPVDVATAPDGSVFITDWYDPVVSWNRQYDVPKGRIYRVAPPGHRYQVDPVRLDNPSQAVEALKSPNSDVRYLARQALLSFDSTGAIAELVKRLSDTNPRIRARALWLLAELEGDDKPSLNRALSDPDPNIRVTAIRAARQNADDIVPYLSKLTLDPSPRVRSECAIALRNLDDEKISKIWVQLASQLDGEDRWNLEALGIAADGRWDTVLAAWLSEGGDWRSAAGRKIVWRSRGSQTPELLAKCLSLEELSIDEIKRLIRAFDFQTDGNTKQKFLATLAFGGWASKSESGWLIGSEAYQRLKGSPISRTPLFQQNLNAFLAEAPINEAYISLISDYGTPANFRALMDDLIMNQADNPLRPLALRTLFDAKQETLIQDTLRDANEQDRSTLVRLLAETCFEPAIPILEGILLNTEFPIELRQQATRALGRNRNGSVALVTLARENRFPEALKKSAGAALAQTMHVRAFAEASEYFPIPQTKGSKTIPGMTDLVVLQGNKERGKEVFQEATCATCHQIDGEGIRFGPDLSAIGTKFPKTGLFESILNPNASVSESYQTITVNLKDGKSLTGLLVSETQASFTITIPGGNTTEIPRSKISETTKSSQSLMPDGLQQLMTLDDLVDLVEYLSSLN